MCREECVGTASLFSPFSCFFRCSWSHQLAERRTPNSFSSLQGNANVRRQVWLFLKIKGNPLLMWISCWLGELDSESQGNDCSVCPFTKCWGPFPQTPPALSWLWYQPQEEGLPGRARFVTSGTCPISDVFTEGEKGPLPWGHVTQERSEGKGSSDVSQQTLQIKRIGTSKIGNSFSSPYPAVGPTLARQQSYKFRDNFLVYCSEEKGYSFAYNQMSLCCELGPYSKEIKTHF